MRTRSATGHSYDFARQSSLLTLLAAASACAAFFERPTTPLHQAAWAGNIPAITRLVKDGEDVNAVDAQGYTALYWAARGGHAIGPHTCRGEDAGRAAVIAALLDLGADPNIRDRRPRIPGGSSGWTPLVVALHHEQWRAATVLLERGADVNIRTDQGVTAAGMAAAEGAPAALRQLIATRSTQAVDRTPLVR